ncbi:MAG: GNAT family N-acetyltransferase [Candidatus Lokiarchaeota archaeon]|nr:GNAT family N-acetyltransferase [Candidatus Lokiarchaeota archaeon]MBD3201454.1 GNAT family N-acetyltransferase [Candidatus Lokiarchaeota archaeon]
MKHEYPIYVALENEKIIGYCVIRIFDDVVWEESRYIIPEARRMGVGSKLFKKAENIAKSHGNETLYNWVHPNNQQSIVFLKMNGYEISNIL